jgi:hypothetical protein
MTGLALHDGGEIDEHSVHESGGRDGGRRENLTRGRERKKEQARESELRESKKE